MNKRAQYFWPLMVGVIALIVIGSFMYAVGFKFDPKFKAFFNFLPGFGQENVTQVSSEALRYSIPSDTLSYYTGSDFEPIPQGSHVRLNDKYIESDIIRKAINDYYFDLNARLFYAPIDQILSDKKPTYRFSIGPDYKYTASIISFSSAQSSRVESSSLWSQFLDYVGSTLNLYDIDSLKQQEVRRGDVVLALTTYSPPKIFGSFIVHSDDSFIFVSENKASELTLSDSQKTDLLKQVVEWRDSILKDRSFEKTLDIPYKDKSASGSLLYVTVQPYPLTDGDLMFLIGSSVPKKDSAAELREKYKKLEQDSALPVYEFSKYSLKQTSSGVFSLLYAGTDTGLVFIKARSSSSEYSYTIDFIYDSAKGYSKFFGYVNSDKIYKNAIIPDSPVEAPFTKEAYGHMAALKGKSFASIPVEVA